ncbi:hypothetical protein AgCh_011357 [Apium graveolens]
MEDSDPQEEGGNKNESEIEEAFEESLIGIFLGKKNAQEVVEDLKEMGVRDVIVVKGSEGIFFMRKEHKGWLELDKEKLATYFVKIMEYKVSNQLMPRLVVVECEGISIYAWTKGNLKAFTKDLGEWVSWSFDDPLESRIYNPRVLLIPKDQGLVDVKFKILVKEKIYETRLKEVDLWQEIIKGIVKANNFTVKASSKTTKNYTRIENAEGRPTFEASDEKVKNDSEESKFDYSVGQGSRIVHNKGNDLVDLTDSTEKRDSEGSKIIESNGASLIQDVDNGKSDTIVQASEDVVPDKSQGNLRLDCSTGDLKTDRYGKTGIDNEIEAQKWMSRGPSCTQTTVTESDEEQSGNEEIYKKMDYAGGLDFCPREEVTDSQIEVCNNLQGLKMSRIRGRPRKFQRKYNNPFDFKLGLKKNGKKRNTGSSFDKGPLNKKGLSQLEKIDKSRENGQSSSWQEAVDIVEMA